MHELRRSAKVFIAITVVLSVGVLALALINAQMPRPRDAATASVFVAGIVIAMFFPLQFMPQTKFSFHTSIMFASILLLDPGLALLVCGAGMCINQLIRRESLDQVVFNTSATLLQAIGGITVLYFGGWNMAALTLLQPLLILVALVAAVSMYVVEIGLLGAIIALQTERSAVQLWTQMLKLDWVTTTFQFALGLLGAVVINIDPWTLPLLLPPAYALYRASDQQARMERQAKELEHQASHDPLTGLPNRVLFLDRLQHALARVRRNYRPVAVLFLDLDRFKLVNDSLGHDIGDQLLVAVSRRIEECLRPEDTVARLGGDEFTILLEDIEDLRDATTVAARIWERMEESFVLDGHELIITASIGIVLSVSADDKPEDLVRDADVAMYRAKQKGAQRYEIFDVEMGLLARERLALEADLRHALVRQELRVYYQPRIDLMSGEIKGVEALLRWQHPQRGLLPPLLFISIAEETGLIGAIGNWVLEQACTQVRRWQQAYPSLSSAPLSLSVNLSVTQLTYPKLIDEIDHILRQTCFDAGHLELEITESVVMEDARSMIKVLQELNDLGVRLAIDDFGTGYSSLSYLQRMPVKTLKIDKRFVEGLGEEAGDSAIVLAVSSLARSLGMQIVAEGVETNEQLAHLRRLGCQQGQGYLFSEPLASDAMERLLASKVTVNQAVA